VLSYLRILCLRKILSIKNRYFKYGNIKDSFPIFRKNLIISFYYNNEVFLIRVSKFAAIIILPLKRKYFYVKLLFHMERKKQAYNIIKELVNRFSEHIGGTNEEATAKHIW